MRGKVSLDRPGRINLPINFLMRGPSFTDWRLFFYWWWRSKGAFLPREPGCQVGVLVEAYVSSATVFSDLTR